MGALLSFGIICAGILVGVGVYRVFPSVLNFIVSLINWKSY